MANSGPDILVSYLHGASVDSAFLDSMTMLLVRDRGKRVLDVASYESGPYLTDSRNLQIQTFLESKANWIWMLDSDMFFTPDFLPRLLSRATPNRAVGALCFAYNGRSREADPVMFDPETGHRIRRWTPGDVVQTTAVGMACVLLHRRMFEAIGAPWFENAPPGVRADQDQILCAKLRHAGFEIVVDTGMVAGHCKRIVVDGRDYRMPA